MKTAIISSKTITGQQTRSLLTLFNIPINEVSRKFDKKLIKTLKIGKFWVFCHFRFQYNIFSIQKTASIPPEKPTGQQIPDILTVPNILIHQVYRKFDKICIKTLKIEKFWNFCQFWGNFSLKKPLFFSSKKTIGQRIRALLNVFNILIHDVYRKKMIKIA